jgi:signal transduction histidine kinase
VDRSKLSDPKRLAAIRRLGVLDSPPEEMFDRLTRIAAALVEAPIALCTIIAPDRQFFKSSFGLPAPFSSIRETPLTHSFCQHVVTGRQPLIVADAREDPLLKSNPAVWELHLIAYAGMPLMSPEGEAVGSFCVIDSKPRQWTQRELAILKELADIVMREFQLRDLTRQVIIEQQTREELTNALVEDLEGPLDRMAFVLQTADAIEGLPATSVEEVLIDAQHLKVKLNDIVDVARLESGKLTPNLQPTNLVEVLTLTLGKTYQFAEDKRVSIEVRLPNQLVMVNADGQLISRVIENLLRHALSFTDVGSLVFVEVSELNDQIRCSVSDSGMGLTDEIRAKIFQIVLPQISIEADIPHSGLGLTFCRVAVEAHGGSVGVFSEEGIGTTLWFTLPKLG